MSKIGLDVMITTTAPTISTAKIQKTRVASGERPRALTAALSTIIYPPLLFK